MALFEPPEYWLFNSLGGYVGASLLNIITFIPFGWILYGVLLLASLVLLFDMNVLRAASKNKQTEKRQLNKITSKLERSYNKKLNKKQRELKRQQVKLEQAKKQLQPINSSALNSSAVPDVAANDDDFVPIKASAKPLPQNTAAVSNVVADGNYQPPAIDLLKEARGGGRQVNKQELLLKMQHLSQVLADFGVKGDISEVSPGPVVTLYNLEPAAGTKSSRVIGLADDIARSMEAISARIATVPGKNIIGIELPNLEREMVMLREILDSHHYQHGRQKLPLALGKDIGGEPVIADLARMPHLLVAGTTGSGKSVGVNAMILSLLYKLSP
ncbi:MAG: DNA translocase FtsK, partial [Pseudomonadota bacterium]